MFRLLFQYLNMAKPEWKDCENIEHLREQRLSMLKWADNNNARFILEPIITDITRDKVLNG